MKTKTAIAIASASLLAVTSYGTLKTQTGTGSTSFADALPDLGVSEAILDVASGDGLLNEQTRKITRRVKTSSGWENQDFYRTTTVDSPYELAFLNPVGPGVATEGQFNWQSSWNGSTTGAVDFSVELSETRLVANLGGLELSYDTAPMGRIDTIGFWFTGHTTDVISFNGLLNGNSIAASSGTSAGKWYLFEMDEALDVLQGTVSLFGSGTGYTWETLSMTMKFFSTPIPVPTPEPSTIAFIGIGALGVISVMRRRKEATAA